MISWEFTMKKISFFFFFFFRIEFEFVERIEEVFLCLIWLIALEFRSMLD